MVIAVLHVLGDLDPVAPVIRGDSYRLVVVGGSDEVVVALDIERLTNFFRICTSSL